jgi:hypothetical protein
MAGLLGLSAPLVAVSGASAAPAHSIASVKENSSNKKDGSEKAVHLSKSESPFRTIITTDAMRFRFDDVASFYRLMLYSNEFADSLEGIVYSSSFVGPRPGSAPWDTDLLQRVVREDYAAVYENLKQHDPRYPTPEHLLGLIKTGNIDAVGEMSKDTEGSLLIKEALLSDDDRPLRLQVWGGTNTVAAALRSISEEFSSSPDWPAIKQRVSEKSEMYIILDQDAVFKSYIEKEWPDIDVTMNRAQFTTLAYPSFRKPTLPQELNDYLAAPFMSKIAQGPMLSKMPLDNGIEPGSCYCEGDSPAFFELIDNGLRSFEDPTYGGWGGRFTQAGDHRWTDWPAYLDVPAWPGPRNNGIDPSGRVADDSPFDGAYDVFYPQSRWIPALQNEFAARSEWQTKSFEEANHPPVVSVPKGRLDITAKPGHRLQLVGTATDPDGDSLESTWWQYREAGTYPGSIQITGSSNLPAGASFVVPADAVAGQTIHVILEVTDDGENPLTRYQRVIVTVK